MTYSNNKSSQSNTTFSQQDNPVFNAEGVKVFYNGFLAL